MQAVPNSYRELLRVLLDELMRHLLCVQVDVPHRVVQLAGQVQRPGQKLRQAAQSGSAAAKADPAAVSPLASEVVQRTSNFRAELVQDRGHRIVDAKDFRIADLSGRRARRLRCRHGLSFGTNGGRRVRSGGRNGFLGERIWDIEATKNLVRKIAENYSLPYFTLTPTFSICPTHGYIAGEFHTCPKCVVEQPTEIFFKVGEGELAHKSSKK